MIDFFYKIGRGFKNAGATVKESQVVGKVIKILFRSGVWSIASFMIRMWLDLYVNRRVVTKMFIL